MQNGNKMARRNVSFMLSCEAFVFALCFVMSITQEVSAQRTRQFDGNVEDLKRQVDEFVNEMLSCRDLTAANVAVVHNQDTLFTSGYGVVDLESENPVTNETLFGIASLSKAFGQALLGVVLNESSQGYTWDSKVREILGEEFYFYDALRNHNATLRDLLSHRMGFPSYNDMRFQSDFTRETLASKVRFMVPTEPFRAKYNYSNIMFGLISHVTEVIGGDTWENLMRRKIFEPLGMTSSGFTHETDLYRPDLVKAYELYNDTMRLVSPEFHAYWSKIGASGSVITSAVDLTKWLKMQLRSGLDETGKRVVPNDVIVDAHTRLISTPESSTDKNYLQPNVPASYSHFEYGLAWRMGFYRGWRTILHTGSSYGYLGQITLIPDLGFGIHSSFSGTDSGYTCRRMTHIYIMDLLMGETPWLNKTSACTFLDKNKDRHNRTKPAYDRERSYESYLGTFGNFAFGNVTFYVNESTGGLMMAIGDLARWELFMLPMANESHSHNFMAMGIDHVWMIDLGTVTFSHSQGGATGPFDVVSIPEMEKHINPQFIRGLRMDEAPPPPDITCPEVVTSKASVTYQGMMTSASVTMLTLFCLISKLGPI